jgi:hypothetical protein
MKRKTLQARTVAVSAALYLCLCAANSSAQSVFGTKHQLVVTAEDVFELSTQTVHVDPAPPFSTVQGSETSSRFGFLYSGRQNDPMTVGGPKVGIHFFIIPNLSLGGSVGYEARGGSTSAQDIRNPATTVTIDKPAMSTFVLEPKVGYALMFTPVVGFWFRGGLGFAQMSSDATRWGANSASAHYFLLSLEAPLIISPVPHFAFFVGPTMDVSFAGTATWHDPQNREYSASSSYFGLSLNAGMMGYFDL